MLAYQRIRAENERASEYKIRKDSKLSDFEVFILVSVNLKRKKLTNKYG